MRNRYLSRFLLAAAACGFMVLAVSAQGATQSWGPKFAHKVSAASEAAAARGTAETSLQAAQAKQYWGFLHHYCSKCHNTNDWAGGIAFSIMNAKDIPHDAKIWEMAIQKLGGHLMPPPGNRQPTNARLNGFIHWMQNDIDSAAAKHAPYTGWVALHRLNRQEYQHAVWSLLRVRVDAKNLLPKDDQAGGFDNIADVLQTSATFLNQYLEAARKVAGEAVGNPHATSVSVKYIAPHTAGTQLYRGPGMPLGSRGGFQVTKYFPASGEYELDIGKLAVALWLFDLEFKNHIIASIDGRPFWQGNIGGNAQTKAIDQLQDPVVDALNRTLKHIDFYTTAGPHTVTVTFVHRDFAESEGRLQPMTPGDAQGEVLRLRSFSIKGPLKVTGMNWTPSRRKIFTCMPHNAKEDVPCARQIITKLTREAYRRPVTAQDIDPLMAIYAAGAKAGGFEIGVRNAITAILASPFFLYRAEPTPAGVKPGHRYHLTDLELASRLSFFLWSTQPDSQLISLAAQNRLHKPAVLKAEVLRMLKDPRSMTLASNFAFQWLGIGRLAEIKPDPKIFPFVTDPRPLYRKELKLFVNSIFSNNLDVVDLLTANWTYLNQRLALLYGINNVRGARFRRVTLSKRYRYRYGLLGKGAFLMATSYPTRTAPVLRGKWILDNILDAPPHPPPPGVKMNLVSEAKGHLTMRQEMAIHRKSPSCFACHGVLDPIGLAFQDFDAVGRYRTFDRYAHRPINATATLPGGFKVNGSVGVLKVILMHPSRFVTTLTKKLMTYALGRTLNYRDMPEVRAIVRKAAKDHYRFASIVMGIVESPEFQMRTAPPAAPASPIKTAQVIRLGLQTR